jgi:hypothetical protein
MYQRARRGAEEGTQSVESSQEAVETIHRGDVCLLADGSVELALSSYRYEGIDGRATARSCSNGERALDQTKPFAHAEQSQSPRIIFTLEFETNSGIGDFEADPTRFSIEADLNAARTTVLHSIAQGFLQHAEQAD